MAELTPNALFPAEGCVRASQCVLAGLPSALRLRLEERPDACPQSRLRAVPGRIGRRKSFICVGTSFLGWAVRVDRGRQYPISNKEYPISNAGVAFAPDNRAGRVLFLGHRIFLVGCWVLSNLGLCGQVCILHFWLAKWRYGRDATLMADAGVGPAAVSNVVRHVADARRLARRLKRLVRWCREPATDE